MPPMDFGRLHQVFQVHQELLEQAEAATPGIQSSNAAVIAQITALLEANPTGPNALALAAELKTLQA